MLVTRIVAAVMVVLLGLSIGVQYNDSDGLLWTAIYGFPLLLAVLAIFKRVNPLAVVGVLVYTLAGMFQMPWAFVAQVPEYVSTVQMTTNESEYAREAIGLWLCAAWMLFPAVAWWRQFDVEELTPAADSDLAEKG